MNAAKQPVRTQVVWPARHPIAPSAQGTPWGPRPVGFSWAGTTPALVHVRRMSGRAGVTGLGQDTSGDTMAIGGAAGGSVDLGTATGGTVSSTPTTTSFGQSVLQQLLSAGIQIGKQFTGYANPIYSLAPGTYYQQTPTGTVIATAGAPTPTTTSLNAYMPYILIGGGLLVLVMMAKR